MIHVFVILHNLLAENPGNFEYHKELEEFLPFGNKVYF